jgi:cytochrome c-type biogenesis protein CcsB
VDILIAYLLGATGGLLLVAGVLYFVDLWTPERGVFKIAAIFTILGFTGVTAMIIFRIIASRRLPLSNMFEFGLLFLWCALGVYLYIHWKHQLKSLGIIILPLTAMFAFWLLTRDKGIKPLMPVLRSNWLYFHVFTAIAAYGCFMVSFATGLLYLAKSRKSTTVLSFKLPALELLDELTYKIICIGMPFLTLCIITGAFWAEKAWGSYWSWDPKETWSLIIWLIYAAYLHMRLIGNWRGRKAVYLTVAGFLAVGFTFIGVNLILPGLHSYR